MDRAKSPARMLILAGLFFSLFSGLQASGAVLTSAKRGGSISPAVRQALTAPTRDGQIEALIQIIVGEDLTAAMEAGDALGALGVDVVPRLASQMRRTKNNWLIGGILAKIGPAAVDPLLELLVGADEASAVDYIYLLGELQDRRAIPHLVRLLGDGRDKVRMYCVTSLLEIGGDRAVEAVLEQLVREGRNLGGFIVEALLRHGKAGVEPLLRNASSQNARVRREVAYLLGRLEDGRAAECLTKLLRDSDVLVRRNAAFALGFLAPAIREPDEALRGLIQALEDSEEDVADAAREALVRFGDRSVPIVVATFRGSGERTLLAGLNALRDIGNHDAEGVMVELLRHPKRSVRVAAVAGLMVVGTEMAVEPLLNALRDEDLRWFATLALEKLGSASPELFFSTQPTDPHLSLRTEIFMKLGRPIVPFLLQYLKDAAAGRRAIALWVLGEMGETSAATGVAGLLDDSALGWLAGRTLRKLGDQGLDELERYAIRPRSEEGALQAVEALALFEEPRAIRTLEACVCGEVPRKARVRAAVKIATQRVDPQATARLNSYLEAEGRELRPDVEAALEDAQSR